MRFQLFVGQEQFQVKVIVSSVVGEEDTMVAWWCHISTRNPPLLRSIVHKQISSNFIFKKDSWTVQTYSSTIMYQGKYMASRILFSKPSASKWGRWWTQWSSYRELRDDMSGVCFWGYFCCISLDVSLLDLVYIGLRDLAINKLHYSDKILHAGSFVIIPFIDNFTDIFCVIIQIGICGWLN